MTVHIAPAELDDEPRLIAEWRLLQTPPWRYIAPVEIGENEDWIAARAPGTVAAALEAAGRFDRDAPVDLDGFDHWYRAEVVADGTRRLVFHGLATLAEIFVDGAHVARSDSMFTPLAIEVAARGRLRIDIVFRAMGPKLAAKGPRARWRSRAVQPAAMRFVRSTLIGRMPGWCPPIRAVGPWRAVELRPSRARAPEVLSVRARLERATGVLELRLAAGPALTLRCAGAELRVAASDAPREVTLKAPGAAPWRPQTQGEPALHPVEAEIGGRIVRLGRVGFRSIALDRGADGRGFGLIVNGEPLFCRGANWISADIVSLNASRESLRAQLELAREAGFNMLRCPGSTVYESDDFYALCDELGLLVWQDFMFANLDYPRDEAFLAGARAEAEAFLTRTRWSPSLAVFCGGAEIAQQAAMLGLPEESWRHPLFDALLPDAVAVGRPGAIYVAHSPQGGDLPFSTDAGLCHYYGVTAHLRGFDDIRRSQVRFATECLGLAHPPADDPPLADEAAIAQPIHGERIAGDTGAIWHFEGVRNHYVAQLYGVDCAALRAADPARYLDLSRAATCEVATELFAEWRSAGSPTRGALTLFFQDVAAPGAGWGLIDHRGRPKPVWHA
ncbi:MAG: glycoside hydrolase family 2 protein, partial [Methylobacteriaceae bacterium]|nr:glycoside hydrolase family 2 protein [Methylobacteriaceae bacterium]